jgi:hypothetical protein
MWRGPRVHGRLERSCSRSEPDPVRRLQLCGEADQLDIGTSTGRSWSTGRGRLAFVDLQVPALMTPEINEPGDARRITRAVRRMRRLAFSPPKQYLPCAHFNLAKRNLAQTALQSQTNFDIARWPRTADQHACPWLVDRVDQPYSGRFLRSMRIRRYGRRRAARPLYGNVISLCKFRQTGKP